MQPLMPPQSRHRVATVRDGHGLTRQRASEHTLAEDRRARILTAAEHVLCEHVAAELDLDLVSESAGVSRASLYAIFSDRHDLELALFDSLTQRVGAAMTAAYRSEPRWADAVRAALVELLTFLDDRPLRARFLFAGSLEGDMRMLAHRAAVLDELARALERDSPSPAQGS